MVVVMVEVVIIDNNGDGEVVIIDDNGDGCGVCEASVLCYWREVTALPHEQTPPLARGVISSFSLLLELLVLSVWPVRTAP